MHRLQVEVREQLAEELEHRGCRVIEVECVDVGGVDVLVERLWDQLGEEALTVGEAEAVRLGEGGAVRRYVDAWRRWCAFG